VRGEAVRWRGTAPPEKHALAVPLDPMLIRNIKKHVLALNYYWHMRSLTGSMYPSWAAKVGCFGVFSAPVARRSRRFFGQTMKLSETNYTSLRSPICAQHVTSTWMLIGSTLHVHESKKCVRKREKREN